MDQDCETCTAPLFEENLEGLRDEFADKNMSMTAGIKTNHEPANLSLVDVKTKPFERLSCCCLAPFQVPKMVRWAPTDVNKVQTLMTMRFYFKFTFMHKYIPHIYIHVKFASSSEWNSLEIETYFQRHISS